MRYILAPSSLAGRGLGVGFLYLITPGSAVRFDQHRYLGKIIVFESWKFLFVKIMVEK
jgi:hypothetical protein